MASHLSDAQNTAAFAEHKYEHFRMQCRANRHVITSIFKKFRLDFWDARQLWEYKDKSSSGFLVSMILSAESHITVVHMALLQFILRGFHMLQS